MGFIPLKDHLLILIAVSPNIKGVEMPKRKWRICKGEKKGTADYRICCSDCSHLTPHKTNSDCLDYFGKRCKACREMTDEEKIFHFI